MFNKLFKSWSHSERDATVCSLPEDKHTSAVPMWESMVLARAEELEIDTSKEALMAIILRSVAKLNDSIDDRDFGSMEDAAGDISVALCLLTNEYGINFDDCNWMSYGWMASEDWGS